MVDDSSPATIITTGVETCSKIIQGLLKAPEQGDKMLQKFVENMLLKRLESIYSPNTRKNIDTRTIIKKPPRAISVLKEDIQAFGLLI